MEFLKFEYYKKNKDRVLSMFFINKDENGDVISVYQPFIMFSVKDMFKYPRKENIDKNGSWIFGWLVFYVGITVSK